MSKKSRNSGFERKSGKKALKSSKSLPLEGESRKRAYGMRSHGATTRPRSPKSSDSKRSRRPGSGREGGSGWIWGAHACKAALVNPRRTIHEILLTQQSAVRYQLPQSARRRKSYCRRFSTKPSRAKLCIKALLLKPRRSNGPTLKP